MDSCVSCIRYSSIFDLLPRLIDRGFDICYRKPGSRRQESEVDYIGFWVMVRACHNLDEAATVLASSLQACCVNRELNNLQEGTVYKGRK